MLGGSWVVISGVISRATIVFYPYSGPLFSYLKGRVAGFRAYGVAGL